MDQNLKRSLIVGLVTSVVSYVIVRWLDKKDVLPKPTPQDNGN